MLKDGRLNTKRPARPKLLYRFALPSPCSYLLQVLCPGSPCVLPFMSINELLDPAHARAWTQLSRTLAELEEALTSHERSRYRLSRTTQSFSPEYRWRDSIASALKELGDIRRRVHAHHLEGLREDLADVIFLSQRAALYVGPFDEDVAEALSILEAEEPELLYESAAQSIAPPRLIVSVSDALIARLAREPHLLHEVSARQFEEIVAELFRKEGFDVQLTQETRDGGTDIIAISNRMNIWQKLVIECKRYAPARRVGIAVVQRLLGVKAQTSANKAVVVTTSSFSRDARAVAHERFWDLDLKAYDDVVGWLRAASP